MKSVSDPVDSVGAVDNLWGSGEAPCRGARGALRKGALRGTLKGAPRVSQKLKEKGPNGATGRVPRGERGRTSTRNGKLSAAQAQRDMAYGLDRMAWIIG